MIDSIWQHRECNVRYIVKDVVKGAMSLNYQEVVIFSRELEPNRRAACPMKEFKELARPVYEGCE